MKRLLFFRILRGFTLTATILFLSSCLNQMGENGEKEKGIKLSVQQEKLANAGNEFGFRILEETIGLQTNTMLSPYGLSQVFGMLANGASGETYSQICKIAGFSSSDSDGVNDFFKTMNKGMNSGIGVNFSIKNSLWITNNSSLKRNYASACSKYYSASVQTIDVSKASALTTINNWCARATEGLIDPMFSTLSDQLVMLALNTGYLDAQWASRFNKTATENGTFTDIDGRLQSKAFMQQVNKGDFACYISDEVALVEMPYINGQFSMVCILPGKGIHFEQFIKSLSAEKWEYWTDHLSKETACQVILPKFEITFDAYNLVPILKKMGLTAPFEKGARFDKISEQSLLLSDIRQKNVISVEEDRTLVSSASSATFDPTGIDIHKDFITFRFNEPFLFAIRERSTGVILFLGTLVR